MWSNLLFIFFLLQSFGGSKSIEFDIFNQMILQVYTHIDVKYASDSMKAYRNDSHFTVITQIYGIQKKIVVAHSTSIETLLHWEMKSEKKLPPIIKKKKWHLSFIWWYVILPVFICLSDSFSLLRLALFGIIFSRFCWVVAVAASSYTLIWLEITNDWRIVKRSINIIWFDLICFVLFRLALL